MKWILFETWTEYCWQTVYFLSSLGLNEQDCAPFFLNETLKFFSIKFSFCWSTKVMKNRWKTHTKTDEKHMILRVTNNHYQREPHFIMKKIAWEWIYVKTLIDQHCGHQVQIYNSSLSRAEKKHCRNIINSIQGLG